MKNRREFLTLFGSTLAVGALALTMGAAAKVMPTASLQGCVKDPRKRVRGFHGQDTKSKWIGRKEDSYTDWRKVWSKMAHPGEEFRFSPAQQEQMVDNVFQNDPLFTYLKNKDHMVLNPDKIINAGNIDIRYFGPEMTDTYTTSGTTTGGGLYTTSTTLTLTTGTNVENNINE